MAEIAKRRIEQRVEETPSSEGLVTIGQWYWLTEDDDDHDPCFVCVVYVGSNYALVTSVHGASWRVHFDDFAARCTRESDPERVLTEGTDLVRAQLRELMGQVYELYKKLGMPVDPRALQDPTGSAALAVLSDQHDLGAYSKALEKAKDRELPELFEEIRHTHDRLREWLVAKTLPLKAESDRLRLHIEGIDDKIFNVALYAGLVENVKRIKRGKPAPAGTKVHLFQRLAFMDEECLFDYEHGGMRFHSVEQFDRWLIRPHNVTRLLPMPRCVLAFRVRRNKFVDPYDLGGLSGFVSLMMGRQDAKTFLYIRNGSSVWRLSTDLDFGERLFPDLDRTALSNATKMWGRLKGDKVSELVPESEVEAFLTRDENDDDPWDKELREQTRTKRSGPERQHVWREAFRPFTPDDVMYDDIKAKLAAEVRHHNRIALVLQGLFDRSEVFHPHEPVRLWDLHGFESVITPVYDSDRALTDGDAPSFEAYRDRLNASLRAGSHTVGQEVVWMQQEAKKENERRSKQGRRSWQDRELKVFRPEGDPGPGRVGTVVRIDRLGRCEYAWGFVAKSVQWPYRILGQRKRSLKVDPSRLLNVDVYRPGDFLQFFNDPRTRADYLQWAPLLLAAEDWHADRLGKMNDMGKPPEWGEDDDDES